MAYALRSRSMHIHTYYKVNHKRPRTPSHSTAEGLQRSEFWINITSRPNYPTTVQFVSYYMSMCKKFYSGLDSMFLLFFDFLHSRLRFETGDRRWSEDERSGNRSEFSWWAPRGLNKHGKTREPSRMRGPASGVRRAL